MEGEPQVRARIIRVESRFNPSSQGTCRFDGQPLDQRQIDYRLTVNHERFRIPEVWANVCPSNPDEHIFFDPDVGNKITDVIFRRQHPVEDKLSQLLGG